MTSTPTASAVSTDLADRLLTQAFVIIDVSLSVGPGSRQLTWEALDLNPEQYATMVNFMGAKPPRVEPFPELKSAGVRVKSAVEGFQRRWTVQSGPFRLYPQSDEEGVATALVNIVNQAATERAAVLAVATDARQRWHERVGELLQQAGINNPDITERLQRYFPSDRRLEKALSVQWTLRVVDSLEQQAEHSAQLQSALQDRRELTARERLHFESERMVLEAAQNAADAAAQSATQLLTQVVQDLREGVNGKPMNGQRRVRITNLTDKLESLAQCFSGSGGLLEVADQIRSFAGGTAKNHAQGSAEFERALAQLHSSVNREVTALNDPTKQGHRSIAQFIQ